MRGALVLSFAFLSVGCVEQVATRPTLCIRGPEHCPGMRHPTPTSATEIGPSDAAPIDAEPMDEVPTDAGPMDAALTDATVGDVVFTDSRDARDARDSGPIVPQSPLSQDTIETLLREELLTWICEHGDIRPTLDSEPVERTMNGLWPIQARCGSATGRAENSLGEFRGIGILDARSQRSHPSMRLLQSPHAFLGLYSVLSFRDNWAYPPDAGPVQLQSTAHTEFEDRRPNMRFGDLEAMYAHPAFQQRTGIQAASLVPIGRRTMRLSISCPGDVRAVTIHVLRLGERCPPMVLPAHRPPGLY
ncbi:MAG: hypothetical protein Q8Q09_16515 [Deltaproteobacteria bacterium]|nr:hypothetical protein [Deltaproteobacteria bacterium]